MKLLKNRLNYIGLLLLISSFENFVNVLFLWELLKLSGNKIYLGFAFSLAPFILYFLNFIIKKLNNFIRQNRYFILLTTRFICLIAILISYYFFNNIKNNIYLIYLIIIILNFLAVLTAQLLETITSTYILHQFIKSGYASKLMQFTAQTGIILGAGVAGFFLNFFSFKIIFMFLIIIGILNIILSFSERKNFLKIKTKSLNINLKTSPKPNKINNNKLYILLVLLSSISIVLIFSFLFPVLIQKYKKWTSFRMGVIDIALGVGSILATFFPYKNNLFKRIFSIFCIGIYFIFLSISNNFYLLILYSIVAFYLFTAFRVHYQNLLYDSYSDSEDASKWSKYYAYNTALLRGLITLLCSILIELNISSASIFGFYGLFFIVILLLLEKKCKNYFTIQNYKN